MVASPGPDRTVPRTVRPPRGRLWVEKNLASQTSGPRKGRNKIQFVFCTDMCRAKNSSHPESASFAGAVRGASPNFGIPAQRVPKFLPLPARPAGGRAVTGVGSWAAGQAKKEGGPLQGPPNQKRWVQGGRTSSSLVFFPPTFFKESRAPPPESAGNPRCRVYPAMVLTEPPIDNRAPRPHLGPPPSGCAAPPRKTKADESPPLAAPQEDNSRPPRMGRGSVTARTSPGPPPPRPRRRRW